MRSRRRCTVIAILALATLAAGPPGALGAQSSADSASVPALGTVRGAFMALSVSDIEASRRWYVEKLGLHQTMNVPYANGAAVAVLEGGGLTVELVQLDSAVARQRSAERVHGIFKSGVVVDDLASVLATLRARGVEIAFGPYPARDGQRANAIIRDNAGNWIQLFGR